MARNMLRVRGASLWISCSAPITPRLGTRRWSSKPTAGPSPLPLGGFGTRSPACSRVRPEDANGATLRFGGRGAKEKEKTEKTPTDARSSAGIFGGSVGAGYILKRKNASPYNENPRNTRATSASSSTTGNYVIPRDLPRR